MPPLKTNRWFAWTDCRLQKHPTDRGLIDNTFETHPYHDTDQTSKRNRLCSSSCNYTKWKDSNRNIPYSVFRPLALFGRKNSQPRAVLRTHGSSYTSRRSVLNSDYMLAMVVAYGQTL